MPTFNPMPISLLYNLTTPTANDIIPVFDPEETIVANKTKGIKYSDFIPLGLEALTDPNADKLLYWNNTTNTLEWLTIPPDMSIVSGVLKQKHMLYNTIIPNGTAISPRLGKMIISPELDGSKLVSAYLASFTAVTGDVSVTISQNGSTVVATASILTGSKTGSATGNSTVFSTGDAVFINCTAGMGGDGLDAVLIFEK